MNNLAPIKNCPGGGGCKVTLIGCRGKDTAVGELTPVPFPHLANGIGPNRTRAQWKFTNVYHQR